MMLMLYEMQVQMWKLNTWGVTTVAAEGTPVMEVADLQ
jgi:hypothetical protein